MIYGYKRLKAELDEREKELNSANNGIGLILFAVSVGVGIILLRLLIL